MAASAASASSAALVDGSAVDAVQTPAEDCSSAPFRAESALSAHGAGPAYLAAS